MIDLLPDNVAEVSMLLRQLKWTTCDVKSLEVAGEGNMNRTYRAFLDDGDTLIVKQAVDHVAKYPQIPAPVERAGVEAAFYAAIARYRELLAWTPRLIGYDATNELLAMQDLGASSDFTDLYQGGSACDSTGGALRHLVRWLSALHSQESHEEFPRNAGMRALNHAHIFDLPLNASTHDMVQANFGPQTAALAAEMVRDTSLIQSARELGEIYLGNAPFNSKPVLLHGDFYPGSWLRTDSKAHIIDPEFAFFGPAEFDVGVFTAHLIFSGFAASDIDGILRHYEAPDQYERHLADQFSGAELLRRLLGVAQLPLIEDDEKKVEWLQLGRRLVLQHI